MLLVAAMALTGSNVPLGKLIIAEIPVYVFVAMRFAVATLALLPLASREPGPRLRDLPPARLLDLTAIAAIGMVGFTVFMLEGLKRTAAADAGIITATMPAVVALMGFVLLGERLRKPELGAIGLAVAGLAVVQVLGARGGVTSLLGNLLVAFAVVCEAAFVLIGKRLTPHLGPVRLSLGANVAGLVLSLPLLWMAWPDFHPMAVSPATWAIGVWYALSASVFCLLLWYRGLPYVETWLAGLATAAIPISALVAAYAILGEGVGPGRLAGAALVIAGIALGALSKPVTRP